ncbi:MAG TPA: hypothetical protein IGS52_17100 [Oscillatoriaceae cyanobacterium M33_DOE_052]|uniref:Transcription factor RcaD n=1 Tax=Planktothricoides sp. SpSt-374 TaxID=2282167 RepID=A0A7C3VE10_9CYAN|nr:hypothetical protein [Oscillatoriaceae cyanobacterium M33_DOE_052]
METKELKFLLKLLGFPDYRAPLKLVKPNYKTKVSEVQGICRQLRQRELIDCGEEVSQLGITPAGKSLLKLDSGKLPVSEAQRQVLQTCVTAKRSITANKIGIAAAEAQGVIKDLVDRGLIKAIKTEIKEVWLTERGKEFLRSDCQPSGNQPLYTGEMLKNYLSFLRKSPIAQPQLAEPSINNASKPSDEAILDVVRQLDRELGTDNYLPIFHLRQKLQPPLSRDELDAALYRLQRQDKIELSGLVDGTPYSTQELQAAIKQKVGVPLFFIVAN